MHAVVFERYGGPEVLEYQEVPGPSPSDGKALVEVEAAGINYRDVYEREREGYGSQPPAVIGVEGAGTIAGTGERVAWSHAPGSYAEQVAADRDRLVPVPDGVSSEDAAAAILQGMTAHYLAADSYPIEDGDWVVVHAAAGGVGLLLTQLAKLRGGRVIATTSTEEKAALAREAGADEAIGYEGFAERVHEITGGDGAAAVYDGVGRATFLEGVKALRPLGRMILYGAASGQPDPLVLQTLAGAGALYVQRPTLMS
jgi:NADPH2:quinone reductase